MCEGGSPIACLLLLYGSFAPLDRDLSTGPYVGAAKRAMDSGKTRSRQAKQSMKLPRILILVLGSVSLVGCQLDAPSFTPSARNAGFKDSYGVARSALEGGKIAKAERSYKDLILQSGPLEGRIRLEYAHVLLRAGKFADASGEARVAVSLLEAEGKSAALAVQATADQELARLALASGQGGGDVRQRLISARDGFDTVLKEHPQLDPLGALALRRKTVEAELEALP